MKTLQIIEALDVGGLKSLGSFAQVRGAVEASFGSQFGCRGWSSLFSKLKSLKSEVPRQGANLLGACERAAFQDSVNEVSNILGVKVKAKTRSELVEIVNCFIRAFPPAPFDPYEYYEKTKLAKFKGSSKLEGIDVDYPDESVTLESVLNKHRR
ncbi:YhfG family protein [Dyella ginsengisoli]|uniref:YhfG family protein n=1 Tax=Dyella ginsengisoli TaxID=363848 RepID=UPI00035D19DA|nr:YhfG family protein [Dyella ginsengisoli]